MTFLHHCADVGAAVLVHPWDMMARERMPNYMMPWTVAMPAETQLGIVALILSGAFDRLPRRLRICFAHGGGSFAFLLGRMQNAWEHHPVARGKCELPPVQYTDRFHVDSAVFDPSALEMLVEKVGEDRVMLGSDYPFPLGDLTMGKFIEAMDLSKKVKEDIFCNAALEWLDISKRELVLE